MDLCHLCQTIDIRNLLEGFHNSEQFAAPPRVEPWGRHACRTSANFQPHQASLAALRDAANSGCRLCGMIWARHCSQRAEHGTDDCMCKRYSGPVRFTVHQGSCDSFVLLVVLAVSETGEQGDPDAEMVAELEISTAKGEDIPLEDAHLLARVARDERPSDLRSDLCLSMGVDWLRKCVQEHVECKPGQNAPPTLLPTRVIDVGSTLTHPRLYISGDGEVGEWAALSYCWGGDSHFTLTAASVNGLLSGIPLSDFPPTLRDAVVLARVLGIQYLWIDALCIFQDDVVDWRAEVSKMGDVYAHAVVTIAAGGAESVGDGFLDRREPHFNCPLPWRRHDYDARNVPGNASSNGLGGRHPILLRAPVTNFSHLTPEQSSRWATRGWTFQEQVVSKRLLCYTRGRMVWHCRAGIAIEPAENPESDVSRVQVPAANPDDGADSTEATYSAWYKLLKAYTKRQLTFDDDRLPAIGAVARRFQAHLGDQYCAGLWRGDLLRGLLWAAVAGSDGRGPPGSPLQRALLRLVGHQENTAGSGAERSSPGLMGGSSEHRVPSWSWAGAKSGVELSWPNELDNCTYLASVVNVEVRRKPGDNFGCVEGGELVLEAPYRHLRLWLGSYAGSSLSPASLVLRALTRLGPLPRTRKLAQIVLTRPDFLASTASARSVSVPSSGSTKFTLIQIAKTDSVVYLLVLQPLAADDANSGGRQCYRRVGLLRLQPWAYDDDKYLGEEMTDRLEGAAYREVTRGEWPSGRFVIV